MAALDTAPGDIKMKSGSVWPRHLERALLIFGLILVAVYALAKLHSEISAQLALRKFEAERKESRVRAQESVRQRTGEEVDFSLWSDKRVHGYLESLVTKPEPPAAVLRIPKLRLEVPVYDGTDDLTLNRGVGRRSEEHTSELQSLRHLVCRLLLEKKNKRKQIEIRSRRGRLRRERRNG